MHVAARRTVSSIAMRASTNTHTDVSYAVRTSTDMSSAINIHMSGDNMSSSTTASSNEASSGSKT